jgi:hypothetical protein
MTLDETVTQTLIALKKDLRELYLCLTLQNKTPDEVHAYLTGILDEEENYQRQL